MWSMGRYRFMMGGLLCCVINLAFNNGIIVHGENMHFLLLVLIYLSTGGLWLRGGVQTEWT